MHCNNSKTRKTSNRDNTFTTMKETVNVNIGSVAFILDEDAYRAGRISTSLYGYLNVPLEQKFIQNRKAPTPLSDEAAIESIAYEVTDHMEPDVVYLVGAGTCLDRLSEPLSNSIARGTIRS